MMRLSSLPTLLVALAGVSAAASDDKKSKVAEPCTIASSTGSFFDLRPLSIAPPDGSKNSKNAKTDSWHSKGYDYKSNFTLNICAPIVEKVDNVVGVDEKYWTNISALYEVDSKTYSLGQLSTNLTLRGRMLVLQYTGGSPCRESKKGSSGESKSTADDKDSDNDVRKTRRKSATISFHCEKDPLVTQTAPAFVATDPDECAYFFEVRSQSACGRSEPAKQGVGPTAVFAIIGVIAILVYFIGGVFYQRNVAHARGWRQLPNYSMWAGIGSFIKDFFIIATSSCARFFPDRRGYAPLSISANGNSNGRGRGSGPEDENRLIDQLDEEWDD